VARRPARDAHRSRARVAVTARLSNPASIKDWRTSWYGTQIWKNRRRHQLRVAPLCALCEEQGRITPATIADHHPPHKGDYNVFVLGELRSLCAPCHDGLQAIKHKGYRSDCDDDGYPIDKNHPFNRVR
jgi:5-methylcytosine-specific restriction protein A